MLIRIEDYLNRRRQFQPQAQPLLVVVGGTMSPVRAEARVARQSARIHVLPLTAVCCDSALEDSALPSASELGGVYAEATLV
jgi:hypothetical protein